MNLKHEVMGLLKNFFTRKKEKNDTKQTQENYLPISNILEDLKEKNIIIQSKVPQSVMLGNMIFEKKYQEAINLGLELLKKTPEDSGVHINLMDAYFKLREQHPDYINKKKYHLSLQLYNLILNTEGFHFSTHGCGNIIDWEKRRKNIIKNMDKATDKENDILFTEDEISKIIKTIYNDDIKENKTFE
jgi:hypothetical protein